MFEELNCRNFKKKLLVYSNIFSEISMHLHTIQAAFDSFGLCSVRPQIEHFLGPERTRSTQKSFNILFSIGFTKSERLFTSTL